MQRRRDDDLAARRPDIESGAELADRVPDGVEVELVGKDKEPLLAATARRRRQSQWQPLVGLLERVQRAAPILSVDVEDDDVRWPTGDEPDVRPRPR